MLDTFRHLTPVFCVHVTLDLVHVMPLSILLYGYWLKCGNSGVKSGNLSRVPSSKYEKVQ